MCSAVVFRKEGTRVGSETRITHQSRCGGGGMVSRKLFVLFMRFRDIRHPCEMFVPFNNRVTVPRIQRSTHA